MLHYHSYRPGESTCWSGRETDPSLGVQYWYQAIRPINLKTDDLTNDKSAIGLLGYACDEGVRRNQGRVGASQGPDAIRSRLARITWHHNRKVIDAGTISCLDSDLEKSQQALSSSVHSLLKADIFPVLLGGGHDIAFGHFQGIRNFLPEHESIGIINFDAHFDLRRIIDSPNSGTPFFQILSHPTATAGYLPIGTQRGSNTSELFETARKFGISYIPLEDCQQNNKKLVSCLDDFINQHQHIYISIDLDGFAAAYAPGVSAPAAIGLDPAFVLHVLSRLFDSGKVSSVDIAEMNPEFDRDGITARLAARLVDEVVRLNCL